MPKSVAFDFPHPLDARYVEDPYPYLARARRERPVCHLEGLDLWLITRYEDIKRILMNPKAFSNANAQQPLYPLCDQARYVLEEGGFAPKASLTASDPPSHTRLRKYYSQVISFTPSRTETLKTWLREQIDGLIDGFVAKGHADLVRFLTAPLPAKVIFHLIGFPEDDGEKLLGWCEARLQLTGGRLSPEEQVGVAQRMVKYWSYCERFVAARADDLRDDYTSELLHIHRSDREALSIEEITTLIYALTFAGQETTHNFMSSMLRLLLEEPSRWEALLGDRTLIPAAVEESLRLEPPIAAWRRQTTCDTEIAGTHIPAGANLLLHLGSAGRDADTFPNGETFDVYRTNANAHLALGHGIHFCLGAGLARAESQLVLGSLLERLPDLSLKPGQQFSYISNVFFRGPKQLFAQWTG